MPLQVTITLSLDGGKPLEAARKLNALRRLLGDYQITVVDWREKEIERERGKP